MSTEEETYKGKKITVSDDGLKLNIEGKEIHIDFDEDGETYSVYTILPYVTFPTLLDLAKAIFEKSLNIYYKSSPPIADLMRQNKLFKYTMKYSVVWPFVALARTAAFLINPFIIRKTKR